MTYNVFSGTLNPTHSLTQHKYGCIRDEQSSVIKEQQRVRNPNAADT